MDANSILIAETDPNFLDRLPALLSNKLPHLDFDICTSPTTTAQKLSRFQYSTVVGAPDLIWDAQSSLPLHIQNSHALMPVIVTAAPPEIELARDALLNHRAFDVIAKPLNDAEALRSLRVALWQQRFLKLLVRRDKVMVTYRRHIEAFPEGKEMWDRFLKQMDETVDSVRESLMLLDVNTEGIFYDLAGSVEEQTMERALSRLNTLSSHALEQRPKI